MKRVFLLMPLLLAGALLLAGCSVRSVLPSANLVSSTPTPVPTLPPTPPPVDQSSTSAFDNAAGNCVDAANQAIKLSAAAATGRFTGSGYNMDMHLALEPHGPHSGCADSPAQIKRYRQYVSSARLTVWALDSGWVNASPAFKQQWLVGVLNALLAIYPRAEVDVQVLYNDAPCGSISIGTGNGGGRQINPTCS